MRSVSAGDHQGLLLPGNERAREEVCGSSQAGITTTAEGGVQSGGLVALPEPQRGAAS